MLLSEDCQQPVKPQMMPIFSGIASPINTGVAKGFCKLAEMEIASLVHSRLAMPVQHYFS